jgi:hypothetical protein
MKKTRLRVTTQQKLAILKEVDLIGLQPTLQKYHVTVEMLCHWQKKFKGSKAGSSINLGEDICEKGNILETKPVNLKASEKEEELLRLVASLIVQSLLE